MSDLQLLIRLAAVDQLLSPLSRNTQALGEFDRQLARVRRSAENLQSLGRNLGGVGLAAVAPVQKSLTAFGDLESAQVQLKNAMTTVGGLDASWGKINQQAIEAGNLYPGTTADFLNLAGGMKQMGMDAKTMTSGAFEAASALQVMFKLNPAEAGEAFVQMGKGLGIAGSDSVAFADAIQRVSYSAGLKLPEIKEAMKYAGAGMKQFGVEGLENSKTVLAMMGALKQANVEGSQIGTTFQGAFGHIAEMGARLRQGRGEVMQEAKAAMAKAGVDLQFFDKGGKFLGMENFVNQFDKMKGLSDQARMMIGKALFGEEGAKMALLDGDKMRAATKAMIQQEDLQKRLARIRDTLGNKAEAAKGSFTNLLASVGEKLAPSLSPLLDKLNTLLGRLQAFTDAHPKLTAAIAGTAGTLGVFAIGLGGSLFAAGKIRSTVADGLEAFRAFRGVVGGAGTNLKLFREYSALAGGPLKGLTTMMQDAGGWTGKLGKLLGTDLSPALGGLKSGFMKLLAPLWGAITATWSFTVALLANPITWVVVGVLALVGAAIALWKNWDKVTTWFKNAWAWFQGLWEKVPGWAKWLFPFIQVPMLIIKNWGRITAWFKDAWAWLQGLWEKVPGWAKWLVPIIQVPLFIIKNWSRIKSFFTSLWDFIKGLASKFWEAGKNIVKSIWEGMKSLAMKPVEAIAGIVEKVRKYLPFSPAKEGPLRDIHKIRLVETIAEGLKPDALTGKIGGILGQARGILSKGLQVGATVASGLAVTVGTGGGGGARPIQITIQVDARGAAPGAAADIEKAVLRAAPALKRELARLDASAGRRTF